ncbi:MAG: prolyl oligopeptidase family serine peptidase [Candidatus Binatus sp.]|uniref:alpha/beta hydrolase n=1 Tax=Candidatus Binatus sp. TaxID=2811406 RepID=UPI00271A8EE9|nr:prolyl oligopeptidase family serine peptidase [Candidatus Binatus sp.]MDO8433595.1 prolyl oligopeptidase family serine peptidase [Candidatus Binatus sp.]
MSDESNPQAVGDAGEPEPKRRGILGVGSIILGVPLLLWMVTAFIVSRSLKYPPSLEKGTGHDVLGEHIPIFTRGSVSNIRAATGLEPQRLDCGAVRDDSFRGRSVPVIGWFFAGSRPEVIVLLPPAGGDEVQIIPYVKFLHAAGYNILAAYSANNPKYGITWGLTKRKFAFEIVRELNEDGYDKVAAIGISEGGAAAILAQSEKPVFKAIVVDSSYANLAQTLLHSPAMAGLNPAFARTVIWEAYWWFGKNLFNVSPAKAAANLGKCPLLIIQNSGDPLTPVADGEAIRQAASGPAELWITPSKGHADAIFQVPKEYAAHVTAFLDKVFGPAPAVAQAIPSPIPAASPSPSQHKLRERLKMRHRTTTTKAQAASQ